MVKRRQKMRVPPAAQNADTTPTEPLPPVSSAGTSGPAGWADGRAAPTERFSWLRGWQVKAAVAAAIASVVVAAGWAHVPDALDRISGFIRSSTGQAADNSAGGGHSTTGSGGTPGPAQGAGNQQAGGNNQAGGGQAGGNTGSGGGGGQGGGTGTNSNQNSGGSTGGQPVGPTISKPPVPTTPPVVEDSVRRRDSLTMPTYLAFDLDSMAEDWDPTDQSWGPTRDVSYAAWVESLNSDAIISRYDPQEAAALSGNGPWSRSDCAGAAYGQASTRPYGERILINRAVCVHTSEGRFALLVVTNSVQDQLTVDVTVWN